MLEKLKKWLIGSVITNFIRHGLTALSAVLIAQGVDAATAGQFTDSLGKVVLQLLPVLIALVWSYFEKRTLLAAVR
jgi:hypothetical protein